MDAPKPSQAPLGFAFSSNIWEFFCSELAPEASDKGLQRAGAPLQACIHRKGNRTKPQKPSCPDLLYRTEVWLGFASDLLCLLSSLSLSVLTCNMSIKFLAPEVKIKKSP